MFDVFGPVLRSGGIWIPSQTSLGIFAVVRMSALLLGMDKLDPFLSYDTTADLLDSTKGNVEPFLPEPSFAHFCCDHGLWCLHVVLVLVVIRFEVRSG